MEPELIRFAKSYRRLLRMLTLWASVFKKHLQSRVIFSIGRWLSPFQLHSDRIRRSMGLALPSINVNHYWHEWLNSHIRFILDFLTYRSLDIDWVKRNVDVPDPTLLAALQNSGGLLLTYHSHHQNTLCCALGLEGITISAIAAKPEDSPLFQYIGRWSTKVNSDSELHFNGGSYIFTNNLRKLLHATRDLLAKKEVIVCLCDFNQPRTGIHVSAKLFGRLISPPTGAIDIALKHHAPIYAAMFAPKNGKLTLELKRLEDSGELEAVVTGYFSFLESCIRTNPACWQGWEWFENLPLAEQNNP